MAVEAIRPPTRRAPTNGAAPKFFKCTDTGNAERLVAAYGDRIRYCVSEKTWLLWDDTRWARDARGEINALAKDVVRAINAEASRCSDDDVRKEIGKWARKSESRTARLAMVKLAETEPGIAVLPQELDADPWVLNTPTCTVDLRTGIGRPHRREDLLTKCTAAPFDPLARSALWERVLLEAMGGDVDTLAFFQRSAGYSCTGDVSEEKLFLCVGPAASGKSTIIQAIVKALGGYTRTADFEAFITTNRAGAPKNEIARLAGSRFVASIVVDKGKHLAHALVKTLTGGDIVAARFLFRESFEFSPTFKLWLVCNDAPQVDDDDTAMWRRMIRMPFEHVVPADKRDPSVKAELTDPAKSGAAVLAWLVQGALAWQAKGLGVPQTVRRATDAYRSEQDPLREFVAEACFLDSAVSCTRKLLREAYERWAREAGGREVLTGQSLSARIRTLDGVGEKTLKGTRYWTGIGLTANARDHYQGAGVHLGADES
jgi:putative DNA primase/helicase